MIAASAAVINSIVRALRKNIDPVQTRRFQRLLELLLRETFSDVWEMFRSMEIQVNLTFCDF